MRLLRLAVENQRWDLAAYAVILALASVLTDGGKNASRRDKNQSIKKG